MRIELLAQGTHPPPHLFPPTLCLYLTPVGLLLTLLLSRIGTIYSEAALQNLRAVSSQYEHLRSIIKQASINTDMRNSRAQNRLDAEMAQSVVQQLSEIYATLEENVEKSRRGVFTIDTNKKTRSGGDSGGA